MLAYVHLISAARSELPEISKTTIMDKFLMIYTITSCMPASHLFGAYFEPDHETVIKNKLNKMFLFIALAVYFILLILLFILTNKTK